MELRAGQKLFSTVCRTQVIVVRAPGGEVDLRCGGVPMATTDDAPDDAQPEAGWASGTLLGKRYANDDEGLEVLCARAGTGSLGLGTVAVEVKSAKPLPASD